MNDEQSTNSGFKYWLCLMEGCGGLTAADRRNYRLFHYWVLATCFVAVVISLVLPMDLVAEHPIVKVVILIPLIMGFFTIKAYVHFFKSVDELTQKIQLEGIKFGFAIGICVVPTFQLIELVSEWRFDSMTPWALMVVGYSIGLALAARRYL